MTPSGFDTSRFGVLLVGLMILTSGCTGDFGATSAKTKYFARSVAGGSFAAAAGEPTLADVFTGRARFQSIAESEEIGLSFGPQVLNIFDQKMPLFQKAGDPLYYTVTRGYVGNGQFRLFVLSSVDGVHFQQKGGQLFPGLSADWVTYDAHVAFDSSRGLYLMTMECASASFGFSLCMSTSATPDIAESWSSPSLVIAAQGLKSASTGVVLVDNGAIYVKWTVVDFITDPFVDEGGESTLSRGTQIAQPSGYSGDSQTGTVLMGATPNIHCLDAWDCNNRDAQDWKREGNSYYLIYNGANYFGCIRNAGDPDTSDWSLAIRRSSSPLGDYSESSGILIRGERKDTCGISYPVINEVAGATYMYYAYYPAAGGNKTMRSRLVWADQGAAVASLYRSVLRREPDAGGLAAWASALAGGTSVASARQAFAASPEARMNLNQVYNEVLGRDIDESGAQFYASALGNEVSYERIKTELQRSAEFQRRNFIRTLYRGLMGREGSNSEVSYWAARPMTSSQIADAFFHSPEYGGRWGAMTNSDRVATLYRGLLGREPDPCGLTAWTAYLDGGASCTDLLNGFLTSAEFIARPK